MILLWASPFVLQGLIITFDEFRFHRRRGLPLWERIGHPLDSAILGLALLIPLLSPLTKVWVIVYALASLFSCLFVTKDEYVHTDLCESAENWLHSLLYQLHPIVLITAGLLWSARSGHPLIQDLPSSLQAGTLLVIQASAIFSFMAYQLLYWRFRPST